MYTTSTIYKSKIKEASRNFLSRITIGDKIITNDELVSLSIDGTLHSSDSFMIGGTASKSIDLIIIKSDDTVYTNQNIKVEIGLNLGDTVEYVLLGYFNIDQVEKTEHTIKFIAYDNMIKFEKSYFSNLGDTPTLQQVVNELVAKTGVQFVGSLPNYTVSKLNEYSCREVLSYVASLCGGNALITREGKFTIIYPSEVSYSITGANYIDYKREDVEYKIGKLTCQVGEDILEKGVLSADSRELQFENPWVTTAILNDLYTKLNGFEYLGYSMKWQGDIALDLGDIITCTDIKRVTRRLPIFSQKFNFTGGLTSEIAAKGETENQNSFSSNGSTAKNVQRIVTQLAIVNKALVDVAYIGDLTANNINFDTASGGTLSLQTLLSNFITGESGQFLNLTGDNVVITNAVIKDAMIESISTTKIKAGSIDTNKITLSSADGGLSIVGPTMQFKDKSNRVRLQLGQDAVGDFNFILRGIDGTTTLIDNTGIKEKAISNDLIKENMVAADAIGEKQINYSSLITGLNKDTNTQLIKASKVAIDLEGQSLEVAFNSLKSNVDNIEVGGRNYFRPSLVSTYSPYNILSKVEGNTITTTYNREATIKYFTISMTGFAPPEEIGTISGYMKLNGIPITNSFFATKKATTYGKEVLNFYVDDTTGYFSITQNWGSRWLLHTVLNENIIVGDIIIIEKLKFEKGNKATDWTPAPEDIEDKIKANTTLISAQQGKITTLISDTSIIKGDVTTINNNYSSLTQTVNGLSSTVGSHKTSISDLNSSVFTMQSSITQLNDKIALKVEASDITNAINSVNTDNLIIDGSFENDGYLWSGSGEIIEGGVDGGKCLKLIKGRGKTLEKVIDVMPNQKYKFSLWYKTSADNNGTSSNQKMRIAKTDGSYLTAVAALPSVEWTYKEITYTIPNDIYKIKLTLQTDTTVGWIYYDNLDVVNAEMENSINSLSSRIKAAEIKITDSAIISTVQSTINTAKTEAIASANGATDSKLANYSTTKQMTSAITQSADGVKTEVSNSYLNKNEATDIYATKSSLTQTANSITASFKASGGYNLIRNSTGYNGTNLWTKSAGTWGIYTNNNIGGATSVYMYLDNGTNTSESYTFSSRFKLKGSTKYTLSGWFHNYTKCPSFDVYVLSSTAVGEIDTTTSYTNAQKVIDTQTTSGGWKKFSVSFTTPAGVLSGYVRIDNNGYNSAGDGSNRVNWSALMLNEGEEQPWSPHPSEVYDGSTIIDANGVTIKNGDLTVKNNNNVVTIDGQSNMFKIHSVLDFNINAGTNLQYRMSIKHGLGYIPAFVAYQVDPQGGVGKNVQLPAFSIGGIGSNTVLSFTTIIRASADTQNIYVEFTRASASITSQVRVRVFVYKEALI